MVEKPKVDVLRTLVCLREAMYESNNPTSDAAICVDEWILRKLGLKADVDGPYMIVSSRESNGLLDAVVIYYEHPGALAKGQAKERLVKYVEEVVHQKDRALGIIVSDRLAFVGYDPLGGWTLMIHPIERRSVVKMVEALRGLTRKSLYDLAEEFGIASPTAKKFTSMLYEKLERSEKGMEAYSKWSELWRDDSAKRFLMPPPRPTLFEIVEGYGLEGIPYALTFSLQTYIALLLKLIATEAVYVYSSGETYESFLADLANGNRKDVYRLLSDLEKGAIFQKYVNFLDGNNYFSWYLDVFDEELASAVVDLARRLTNYEIATPQLTRARDLFQILVGNGDEVEEAAERILDKTIGNACGEELFKTKILDPLSESGTLLIAYINRLRRCVDPLLITPILLGNVVGYAQDPLMAIAARVNWYLAVADVIEAPGQVDIPIYLTGLQIPFNYFVSLSQR